MPLYYNYIQVDRSLYFFACNKRTCSLTNKGWKLIRNQSSCFHEPINQQKGVPHHSNDTSNSNIESTNWKDINDENVYKSLHIIYEKNMHIFIIILFFILRILIYLI